MENEKSLLATSIHQRLRIDKVVSSEFEELSRSNVQHYLALGAILVNGESVKPNYKVKENDLITIDIPEAEEITLEAEDIPLDIVYEDEDLVIVNKNYDMVVHPAIGNYTGTLVNALMFHVKDFKAIKGEIRPGIVHRIDKETSGLLVVAKNNNALEIIGNQLREKTVKREYLALVEGVIPHNLGKVNAPIGRDKKNRQKMAVVDNGKDAITNFKVLERFEHYTLIECVLETGRTHQIRVHLNYIGFPIVGDKKYGRKKTDTTHGQYLHAKTLGFIHPSTKEYIEFDSEIPEFFKTKLEELRNA